MASLPAQSSCEQLGKNGLVCLELNYHMNKKDFSRVVLESNEKIYTFLKLFCRTHEITLEACQI